MNFRLHEAIDHDDVLHLLGLSCLFQTFSLVNSHGNMDNMVKPMTLWDENQAGWHGDENGQDTKIGCGVLNLPTDTEFNTETGKDADWNQ